MDRRQLKHSWLHLREPKGAERWGGSGEGRKTDQVVKSAASRLPNVPLQDAPAVRARCATCAPLPHYVWRLALCLLVRMSAARREHRSRGRRDTACVRFCQPSCVALLSFLCSNKVSQRPPCPPCGAGDGGKLCNDHTRSHTKPATHELAAAADAAQAQRRCRLPLHSSYSCVMLQRACLQVAPRRELRTR